MSVTFSIEGDTDQSVVDTYDCEYCNGSGCEECAETGKVVFKSSKWEMNVANGNFYLIKNAFGLPQGSEEDDCCGSIRGSALVALLKTARIELAERATVVDEQPGLATMISCGVTVERAKHYHERLMAIAMEAARLEARVFWG